MRVRHRYREIQLSALVSVVLCALAESSVAQVLDSPEQFLLQEFDSHLQPLSATFLPDTVVAFEEPDRAPVEWHSMLTNIPGDFFQLGQATISVEHIPTLVGLVGVTAILIYKDRPTYVETRRAYHHSPFVREASDLFAETGYGKYHFGLAAGFASYGLLFKNDRAVRVGSQMIEAVLATGICVQTLKHITGRESPIVATRHRGRWKFFPSWREYNRAQASYYAFPSGHISTAMATLTVLTENYPEQSWLKPVGYTWVGLVGVGLVAKGMHWYSDLPLGVALGYAFGKFASGDERASVSASVSRSQRLQLSLHPMFNDETPGVRLALQF
jgi:hypothetical protein